MKKLEKDKKKADERLEKVQQFLDNHEFVYYDKYPDYEFLYGAFKDTDALVDSENVEDRIRMAKWGYGLDKLKDDQDYRVRLEVAKSGYFAHQLIKDSHPEVRKAAYAVIHGKKVSKNRDDNNDKGLKKS